MRVIADSKHIHQWHRWYAWRPVRLTHSKRWVWMRRIYRRACYKTFSTYDDWQRYEYADILGILQLPPEPKHQR